MTAEFEGSKTAMMSTAGIRSKTSELLMLARSPVSELAPACNKSSRCDPPKNAPIKESNRSCNIDARRLAKLLPFNHLTVSAACEV